MRMWNRIERDQLELRTSVKGHPHLRLALHFDRVTDEWYWTVACITYGVSSGAPMQLMIADGAERDLTDAQQQAEQHARDFANSILTGLAS